MTTVGTLGEAMQSAGIERPEMALERLRNMARDVVRQGQKLDDLALAAADDIEIVAALCAPYLARAQAEMRDGKGRGARTEGLQLPTPPAAHTPQSSGAKAGQGRLTNGQRPSTRHRPGHAKKLDPASVRRVSAIVASTVFDSFTVRGVSIGKLNGAELRDRAGQNLHEGYVCRLLLRSVPYSPAHEQMPCEQWATTETLERCIQSAAAMAEAA